MRLSYVVLVVAGFLLATTGIVSSAANSPKTALRSPHVSSLTNDNKVAQRILRRADKNDSADEGNDSEERMFVGTINGVLGKVGSVVETGGAKFVKEAPKKLEKHQKWLKAGLTPSQVRVDIMKKQPWMKLEYLANHKDFYQYAKFMVEYKRLHPNAVIAM
jgi:hypothetical protein